MKSICNIDFQDCDETRNYIMQTNFYVAKHIYPNCAKTILHFEYDLIEKKENERIGRCHTQVPLEDIQIGSKKEDIDFTFSMDDYLEHRYIEKKSDTEHDLSKIYARMEELRK